MRTLRCLAPALLLGLLASSAARAERAPMSPEQLLRTATHVVQARVLAVYARTEREGGWLVTRHLTEFRVTQVEKGSGLAVEGLLYARSWQRRWTAPTPQPPSASGHARTPVAGEVLRVYLARDAYDGFVTAPDGGFNVVGPNGLERLPSGAPAR